MLRKLIRNLLPYGVVTTLQEKKLEAANYSRQRNLYSLFIPDNGVVFDVGANVGNRIRCFRSFNTTVHAFEPQPMCAKYLQEHYSSDQNVFVHEVALGATEGIGEMAVASNLNVLSTLSKDFISKVSVSGRFSSDVWDQTVSVKLQTLDHYINTVGRPDFLKIDVEGYEMEVLNGLSFCVPALSFEWTPELFEQAEYCIHRCAQLGMCQFSMSFGESMQLSQHWSDEKQLIDKLFACRNDHYLFGDIYAKSDSDIP